MTSSIHAADAPPRHSYRISAFPAGVASKENPYFTLFFKALADYGIHVTDDLEIDRRWLTQRAGLLDAVHVHWPESIWRLDGSHTSGTMRRRIKVVHSLVGLQRFLRTARHLRLLRIWTVHNIEPHEGASSWDRYGYQVIARHSDLVICHSQSAVEAIQKRYGVGDRLIVMPMGEHGSTYPPPRPRSEVLARLGLDPRLPTVSCLGRLRSYKGLDLACDAIERLHGRVQLIIGGARHGDFDLTEIHQAAERTGYIVLLDRMLAAQEFADLAAASDAQLLPYREITGSGALLSAVGFGRGVIASDLSYFREILAEEPDAGVVVSSRDPAAWADSILTYLSRSASQRHQAAVRLAERYSWNRCVQPLVGSIREHQQRASRPAAAPAQAATAFMTGATTDAPGHNRRRSFHQGARQ